MSIFGSLKARFLLLTLSIFYEAAFMNRLWADPNFRRASVGIFGLFIAGSAGVLYAADRILSGPSLYPIPDALILGGTLLFLIGSWKGRIVLAHDYRQLIGALASSGTVLCKLSDEMQSSGYIEALLEISQRLAAENDLKATECYVILASEIWIESLSRRGLNLLGGLTKGRTVGDILAGQANMPSM
ncbi:MAG: hypothetical protein NO516_02530 [Candidatus Methanomethylicia archaeon]|nr:hypothetical protein [Candidatus Methanomethylicia archaeon]